MTVSDIWHPRVLWVGIGCQRGTSRELMETAIQEVFRENQLTLSAIAGIATIDTKSNEVGLLELCRKHNLALKVFSAEVLRTVSVPNPSSVVEQVGTPSVAEAAALCALDLQNNVETRFASVLLVPKQIFSYTIQNRAAKIQNQKGAVTIAVATTIPPL